MRDLLYVCPLLTLESIEQSTGSKGFFSALNIYAVFVSSFEINPA
jgi:hypothetical protein